MTFANFPSAYSGHMLEEHCLLTLNPAVVLAMSIWNDAAQQMSWLDSGANGPCRSGEGTPANIQSQHPDTHVVFSNIRWGDIGSTTE